MLPAAAAGGNKVPKLTAEQVENARLKRQLEVTTCKLATTAAALEIMGKFTLSWTSCRQRADNDPPPSKRRWAASTNSPPPRCRTGKRPGWPGYHGPPPHGHTTAEPAQLPTRAVRATPGNKLTEAERTEVLQVFNCERFVDQPPLQIYPTLLEEGRNLCSVSAMYRVLRENAQVREGWNARVWLRQEAHGAGTRATRRVSGQDRPSRAARISGRRG